MRALDHNNSNNSGQDDDSNSNSSHKDDDDDDKESNYSRKEEDITNSSNINNDNLNTVMDQKASSLSSSSHASSSHPSSSPLLDTSVVVGIAVGACLFLVLGTGKSVNYSYAWKMNLEYHCFESHIPVVYIWAGKGFTVLYKSAMPVVERFVCFAFCPTM